MMRCLIAGVIANLMLVWAPMATAQSPGESALSLGEAIDRALRENPRLRAAAERVDIAAGQIRQARLIPNPEVGWEGEEITGDRRGFGEAEHTLTLSQVIELGGKRSARIKSARSGVSIAEIDLESLRQDVLAEVTTLFTAAALSQRRLVLINESIGLAEELRTAAQQKVDAGAAPTAEAIRAGVAVSNARLDSVTAHTYWLNTMAALAAMWESSEPDFDSVRTELPQVIGVPTMSNLQPLLEENPDIRRGTANIQRARHSHRMARALSVPDLTVSAGPRFLAEDRSQTFVLGVSVPIPIFSRNQGDIARSKSAIREAEWEHRAVVIQLRSSLAKALQNMGSAVHAIETMRDEILPAATAVFEEIQRGYRQGRFDYLDLLAAQQDLIGARMRHLDALSDYYQQRIDVERLIGSPIAAAGGHNGQ